jgi:hypothetical protein
MAVSPMADQIRALLSDQPLLPEPMETTTD